MSRSMVRGCFWILFGMAVLFLLGVVRVLENSTEQPSLATVEGSLQVTLVPSSTMGGEIPTATPLPVAMRPIPTLTPTVMLPTLTQTLPERVKRSLELPRELLKSGGKLTDDFETVAGWVKVSGNAPKSDAANFTTGQAGLKLTAGTTKSVIEKTVKWNLVDSACIRLWVYRTNRNSNSFEILLSTRTNFSQYFRKVVTPNPIRWTLVQICQEEFETVREAVWHDPIVKIRLQVNPNDELTFDTLMTAVEPVPVVMIQFDDANETDYTLAFPILQKYGIRATEYVPTGVVGTPGVMSVAQLLDLQRHGWVIGNHTVNHVLLRDLPEAEQEKEIAGALAALEKWGLKGGRYMSYPWGKYNSTTLGIMERLGMLSGRTVSNAPDVFPQVNLFILRTTQDIDGLSVTDVKKLLDAAKLNRRILTLVFHGLEPGKEVQGGTWNEGAFDQVMAYIAEQNLITLTVDEFVGLATGSVKVDSPGELP